MVAETRYNLAFTGVSLRLNDMVKVAKFAIERGVTDLSMLKESGVLGSNKVRTSDRIFREIRKRLEKLTPYQLAVLAEADLNSQKQIAFLSVCKHYNFIRDFTVEVIRDKTLMFDYKINESDYRSFISNKIPLHPELEESTDNTLKKIRQVLFRILEQSGIIDNAKDMRIQPQLLAPDAVRVIVEDDAAWLKIFMMSNMDIKQAIN